MESSILLKNVWVEYAIYGMANRSLKKTLLQLASRGRLSQDVSSELKRVQALKDINLHIKDGDCIGVIGSNGAGKTTLLRVLAGALKPAHGHIRRVGLTASLFDVSLGMNGEASGWDNILLRGLFLGMSPAQIRARTDEIADFSGLTSEQLSRPVRTYSSGMQVKLAFAISTSICPDILLLDEWIWVGDAQFRDKAQQRMTEMARKSRILVIATHADYVIESLCSRAICLDEGRLIADGPVDEMLSFYHHHAQSLS
jgi:ABC-type polysaccharide/polyol phosphate transport system ATPase subunit